MRKVISLVIVAVCICLSCPVFALGEALPSKEDAKGTVVARVNGVGITLQSLTLMMDRLNKQHGMNSDNSAEKEAKKKKALDRLIVEELAWQKARAEGLKAEPAEVDKRLEDLKAMLGDEVFRKMLESKQLTEEALRAEIERGIVLQLIYRRDVEVSDKIPASEDDLKREYEKEKARFVTPERVEITDVIFFLEPEETRSVKIAEGILSAILADKDKEPHNLVPDDTYLVYDTEVKKDTQKELYLEARKLNVGELSGLIKTGDSLHIIKLKAYSPEKQIQFNEVRGYLEKNLKAEALRSRLREWEAELKKGAKIEIMEESKK